MPPFWIATSPFCFHFLQKNLLNLHPYPRPPFGDKGRSFDPYLLTIPSVDKFLPAIRAKASTHLHNQVAMIQFDLRAPTIVNDFKKIA